MPGLACIVQRMAHPEKSEFALRLRAAREAADLTQEEVARRADSGLRAYVRYEQGHAEPTGRRLVRIARALNVTAEHLVAGPVPAEDDTTPAAVEAA
jgi:transcriptional regulator with XRE-family HTH domain